MGTLIIEGENISSVCCVKQNYFVYIFYICKFLSRIVLVTASHDTLPCFHGTSIEVIVIVYEPNLLQFVTHRTTDTYIVLLI